MIPKHSSKAGKRLSMDMGGAAAEPARVLWDMFFPWMSTNLLAVSMVLMGRDTWTLTTLKGGEWFKNHALVKKISQNANELVMQEENPWEILCVPSKD